MVHHRKLRSDKGFTIIELLVVVGIIAVLAAIAIVGIGKVIAGQRRSQTRTILSSTQSMLGEFDRETSLKRQPPQQWNPKAPATPVVPTDFWRDDDPRTALPLAEGLDVSAATDRDVSEENTGRDDLPAVKNTQIAMSMFGAVASVKRMVSAMPTGSLMTIKDSATTTPPAAAIPKDAWGNPIILVPASGLRGVTLADVPGYIVTSVKTYPPAGGASPTLNDGDLAPGARPFFVSAGPDGRLDTGDDNLYSFENQ